MILWNSGATVSLTGVGKFWLWGLEEYCSDAWGWHCLGRVELRDPVLGLKLRGSCMLDLYPLSL